VRLDLAAWLKKGWLFTNRTQAGDDRGVYCFNKENLPDRNPNQRNKVATNADRIQYYRQILTNAGIDEKN
jgi:hypothetical protein